MGNLTEQELRILLEAIELYEGHENTSIVDSALCSEIETKLEHMIKVQCMSTPGVASGNYK